MQLKTMFVEWCLAKTYFSIGQMYLWNWFNLNNSLCWCYSCTLPIITNCPNVCWLCFPVMFICHQEIDRFWTGILLIWSLQMPHLWHHYRWNIGIKMMTLSSVVVTWLYVMATPAFLLHWLKDLISDSTPQSDMSATTELVRKIVWWTAHCLSC